MNEHTYPDIQNNLVYGNTVCIDETKSTAHNILMVTALV